MRKSCASLDSVQGNCNGMESEEDGELAVAAQARRDMWPMQPVSTGPNSAMFNR